MSGAGDTAGEPRTQGSERTKGPTPVGGTGVPRGRWPTPRGAASGEGSDATGGTARASAGAGGTRRRWLQGGPPTEPLPVVDLLHRTPYRLARTEQDVADGSTSERVRATLDLAIRIGELMLRSGAGAPQVEGAVAAVAAAGGLTSFEVDITLQSILLHANTADGGSHAQLRVVRSTRADHARLVAVHRLVDALALGDIDIDGAAVELRRIKANARTFPMWIVRVARAVLAAAVAAMIGATATTTIVTFAVVLLISGVQRLTAPLRLPEFYEGAIVAGSSTILAWLAYVAGVQGWITLGERGFAFIIAGGIVALLPGRAMASAVEDVLSAYAVTGAGRLLSVIVSMLGLVIGIALAIGMTLRLTDAMGLGFVSPAVLELRLAAASVPAALLGAFCVGASGAVTLQSRRHLALLAGALGLIGMAVFMAGARGLQLGPITATGIAAVVIGLLGRLLAQRLHAPAMVLVVPASFGLLPGLTIFLGLYEMVGQPDPGALALQSGLTTLFSAGGILMAIATGTTFGEILAAPWDNALRESARRIRR